MNTIKQFEAERKENIRKLGQNKKIKALALKFMRYSFEGRYPHNFSWLGRPIIQYPQDIMAMEEIVWEVKPDLIIETGIAHGGSLIFYASMLELIGGRGKVLGIDIDIRKHNREEIEKHKMFKRIIMLEGSSIDPVIVKKAAAIAKKYKKIMVCLDSLHTHNHVLSEMNLYSKFVSRKSYLVVFDGIIEYLPKGFFADRPWDRGKNPTTAIRAFLKKNKNFVPNNEIDNELIITSCPGGFLKRVR